ncbi:hypothetical protein MNBD_NITROSPINAE03-1201 [hydrothermal vent metagenome]|uniref:Glycosyltransferase n=1 Tax=hydrothermal vent metagenome TaxID=652676 RepID=A0A3B1CBG4_9ZZZZ
MKILSFSWHEPYISLMAKTGHSFDIAEPERGRMGARCWDTRMRPAPANVSIVSQTDGLNSLRRQLYDLVVCHNFADMALVAGRLSPVILIFHNKLSTEIAIGENTVKRADYLADVTRLAKKADMLVFVSESKRDDWGFGEAINDSLSTVILPGIDADDFPEYQGDTPKALRIGNYMKEREATLGYSIQEKIIAGFDNTLLGVNPDIERSVVPENYGDLKSYFVHHRFYLNTTVDGFEDGYNLAMLEAMASGMPIVSTANKTSPVTDGVEGFISDDRGYLRRKIGQLMADRDMARRMGARAKIKALEMFGIDRFKTAWSKAFEAVAILRTQKAYGEEGKRVG